MLAEASWECGEQQAATHLLEVLADVTAAGQQATAGTDGAGNLSAELPDEAKSALIARRNKLLLAMGDYDKCVRMSCGTHGCSLHTG